MLAVESSDSSDCQSDVGVTQDSKKTPIVVLTGDFNEVEDGKAYEMITSDDGAADGAYRLRDSKKIAMEASIGKSTTFTGAHFKEITLNPNSITHIFFL